MTAISQLLKKGKISTGHTADEDSAGTDEYHLQRKGDGEDHKKKGNVIMGWKIIPAADQGARGSPEQP